MRIWVLYILVFRSTSASPGWMLFFNPLLGLACDYYHRQIALHLFVTVQRSTFVWACRAGQYFRG